MDPATIIIGIIVFFIVIGLIFKIMSFAFRALSLVLLAIIIMFSVGYMLDLQAYMLPAQKGAYIVISERSTLILTQIKEETIIYDHNLTMQILATKTIITPTLNVSQLIALKKLAKDPLFNDYDTVWLILSDEKCTSIQYIANPQKTMDACVPSQMTTLSKLTSLSANEALPAGKIAIKSDINLWLQHFWE